MLKKIIPFLLFITTSAFSSVTVSANLKTVATSNQAASIRFQLQNCGTNVPRVIGAGIVVKTQYDFQANQSTGVASGTIYGNDEIDCGGVTNTVYAVSYLINGVPAAGIPTKTYVINSTSGTFDPSTAMPTTSIPVVAPPAGDNTYLRLDGGNYGSLVFPVDGNSVHKTGNETIAGNKTFTGATTVASLSSDSISTTAIGLKVPTSEAGVIVFDGDSTVVGFGGSPLWPSTVTLPAGYTAYVAALGGTQLTDLQQRALAQVDSHFNPQAAHNILFIKAYTNDADWVSVQATYDRLVSYCRERKKVGWEIIVANMTSRVGLDTPGGFKDTLNALINSNWPAFADDLADLASHPEIGAALAYQNTTYFLPDGYHLTNAGYAFFKTEAENAIARVVARNGVPLSITVGAAGGSGGAVYGYSAYIPSDATVLGTAKLNGGATLFSPAPTPAVGFIGLGRNATSGKLECKDSSGGDCLATTPSPDVKSCGTTATCSNTTVSSWRMVVGTVALATGTATVTGISPAFTSTTSFVCNGTDQTSAAAVKIANTSTSSITITGTGTDVVAYQCVGN